MNGKICPLSIFYGGDHFIECLGSKCKLWGGVKGVNDCAINVFLLGFFLMWEHDKQDTLDLFKGKHLDNKDVA